MDTSADGQPRQGAEADERGTVSSSHRNHALRPKKKKSMWNTFSSPREWVSTLRRAIRSPEATVLDVPAQKWSSVRHHSMSPRKCLGKSSVATSRPSLSNCCQILLLRGSLLADEVFPLSLSGLHGDYNPEAVRKYTRLATKTTRLAARVVQKTLISKLQRATFLDFD
jgi:hypothetical protein